MQTDNADVVCKEEVVKKCLGIFHEYKAIRVFHYMDVSWGDGVPSTTLISKCKHCSKLKKVSHYGIGHLSLEELI